jgi:hypothetical protein
LCASMMTRSSSSVQASLQMAGLRWLCQRSRHCDAEGESAVSLEGECEHGRAAGRARAGDRAGVGLALALGAGISSSWAGG